MSATDGIERDTAALAARGPLTARRGGWLAAPPIAPRAARLAGYLFAVAACAFLLLAAAWWKGLTSPTARRLVQSGSRARARRLAGARMRSRRRRTSSGHSGQPAPPCAPRPAPRNGACPIISADAAGLFRIAFGSVVLACVMLEPMEPSHLNGYDVGGAQGVYGTFIGWLAREPAAVQSLGSWLLAFGSLFIAGVATSVSYLAFVLAFLTWASVRALAQSHHVVSAITIAMICLLPAPVGRCVERSTPGCGAGCWACSRAHPSRRYGFAPWMLTVVLGVAFFAAARRSSARVGHAILNGTVKYQFVTDLHQALVPWGPALTSNHAVAVGPLAGRGTAGSLDRDGRVHQVGAHIAPRADSAPLALLAGFWLFQGALLARLVGFSSWGFFPGSGSAIAARSLGRLVEHPSRAPSWPPSFPAVLRVVDASRGEPFISAYDMYSTTYASPRPMRPPATALPRCRRHRPRSVELPDCEVDEPAPGFRRGAAGGTVERERIRELIGRCVADRPRSRWWASRGTRKCMTGTRAASNGSAASTGSDRDSGLDANGAFGHYDD